MESVQYKAIRNRVANKVKMAKICYKKAINDDTLACRQKIRIFQGTNVTHGNKIDELFDEYTKLTSDLKIDKFK